MRKYLWLVPVVVALTAVLVPLVSDLARDVLLVEFLRFAWTVDRLVDSLPQEPFWLAFLSIAFLVAAVSLLSRPVRHDLVSQPKRRAAGQVADLALLIHRAGRRPYFRRRLVQYLSHLGRAVFAQRHGREFPRSGRRPAVPMQDPILVPGSLPATGKLARPENEADPGDVHVSLEQALDRLRAEPASTHARLDPAVEHFVQFLEEHLEVNHARFHRSRH